MGTYMTQDDSLTSEQNLTLITSLKEARLRVEELEQQLGLNADNHAIQSEIKLSVDEMHEGIQLIDKNFTYVYINDAAANHGRRSKEELIGKKMVICYPGIENTEMFKSLEATLSDRKIRRLENKFKYEDEKSRWFELYIEPHSTGVLVRSIDISEMKELEAQYWQSQKMESLGILAASIAHDFNNKLGIITLSTSLILKNKELSPSLRSKIENILLAAEQSSELTKQLLAFSRKQVSDPIVININEVISQNQKNLKRLAFENVNVKFELASDLAKTLICPVQLDQVLLNLFVNAQDAMPAGGNLTVKTENSYLNEYHVKTHIDISPGPYVVFSISDTGVGINEVDKKRIFEPFFTTKGTGQGTGLGLATVHGIIKQSNGHVLVDSEPGSGTTFNIFLPIVSETTEDVEL